MILGATSNIKKYENIKFLHILELSLIRFISFYSRTSKH
ncbi:hypothetical protein LEP1GSC058_0936 [Leptospira fainei serovar Hurstbridge str. BUT 6]|uniref:Uncharacterized protein n=1 Tax=Leptospira fainei serovar Hurstbridge str. BUT 6 TaxID=1193011 RepID=S3V876_9LEPT|nr:hypothetical protein LEP1GSC058_0936 [Leptospira fainei serovar Hurstbridge str. BUT 6]